jgi:DNA-binding NtrC family response regulator
MPLKILYIDDEAALCEIFVDVFASPTRDVSTISSPSVFLEAVSRIKPDVVFLDYRLPGTTGDELAKLLDPKCRRALISGDLELDEAQAGNVERVFIKPVSFTEVEEFLCQVEREKEGR